ncbi:AraC family transcriptional regulator [Noviherbaspirillum saxi]|uniref:AraC family transcriptional regulator n=1 Tax=Noviherbaspirillum saxi TaxID=2320863 RepID=A0A3A3FV89_9BURK|nr:AraC family transcriptional regulator [Noviherbaspirillum saxi]RJG00128.1 AraC family transcriptional regulator [Noviherbaspirillum saxi]
MTYSSAIDLVRGIRARLGSSGLDIDTLFRQAGLEEGECMADDALTLSDKLSQLWDRVTQASGDPLLGLKVASPQALDRSGMMGHIMRASPDLRTAIENLVRYTPLVSPTVHSTLERIGDRIRITLDLPGGQRRVPQQHYDFIWCIVLRTLRSAAVRDDVKPVLVTYTFPEPDAAHAYANAFGCAVRFHAPANTMEFKDADLDVEIRTDNPMAADWALRMLSDLAQSQRNWTVRMLAKLEQSQHAGASFTARVQRILAEMLPSGEPLREEAARRLLMSERTLQRRLAEEGTNFTRLVDDTRRAMAQQHLSKGEMSLKKLSFQLGFSEPSAFCRACKRWFGQSPSQLQQGPLSLEVILSDKPEVGTGELGVFARPVQSGGEGFMRFKPNC